MAKHRPRIGVDLIEDVEEVAALTRLHRMRRDRGRCCDAAR